MSKINEIVHNVKKAAQTEQKMGCKNAAVFGGFSTFTILSLEKIKKAAGLNLGPKVFEQIDWLLAIMNQYGALNKTERGKVVDTLLKVLENMDDKFEPAPAAEIPPQPSLSSFSVRLLKNIGPKRIQLFHKMGIRTIEDILYHFPRRYEDRRFPKLIDELQHGETEICRGIVLEIQDIRPRKKLVITKAVFSDGQSTAYAVWFNQPFVRNLIAGQEILIVGRAERKFGRVEITVSDFEVLNDHSGGSLPIVPVYPSTEGLNSKLLRSMVQEVLDRYGASIEEFLPTAVLQKFDFPDVQQALGQIHFPENLEEVEAARLRLVFEEFFLLQMGIGIKRFANAQTEGIKHKTNGPLADGFMQDLPFQLTQAQLKVLGEIEFDMEDRQPMNRLVQGDVGSGKTIVAAAALVKTVESGHQGIMMAPTEILARQHFDELYGLLSPLGVQTALLTGSLNKIDKEALLDDIKQGRVDVVVGTHAVIQEGVSFQNVGLVITDEQHRFGVKQRAALQSKGLTPDVLVMTATPIPRTLALTVYGELEISVIDELPPGRLAVKTYWIPSNIKERVYRFIRRQVEEGRQVYYVCPLIEESEKLDVSAASDLAELLQTKIFPDLSVGLMHGRLKTDAKETVMREFKNGRIDILVATTVIEVGVNVPNANLMIIENADRFGLAQLHQLRGRVGRSSNQSYCVLVSDPSSDEGRARMKIMEKTSDGFLIAEEDLKIRGPGEFLGTKQSGLPEFKIADIIKDIKILRVARDEALQLLNDDPTLKKPENSMLRLKVKEKFKDTDNFLNIS